MVGNRQIGRVLYDFCVITHRCVSCFFGRKRQRRNGGRRRRKHDLTRKTWLIDRFGRLKAWKWQTGFRLISGLGWRQSNHPINLFLKFFVYLELLGYLCLFIYLFINSLSIYLFIYRARSLSNLGSAPFRDKCLCVRRGPKGSGDQHQSAFSTKSEQINTFLAREHASECQQIGKNHVMGLAAKLWEMGIFMKIWNFIKFLEQRKQEKFYFFEIFQNIF